MTDKEVANMIAGLMLLFGIPLACVLVFGWKIGVLVATVTWFVHSAFKVRGI